MNTESDLIKMILKNFRKSPCHRNEFFHSDSEIITLGSRDYLISTDTYSDEDHFRMDDPYKLGMNLAACTLSDIFACGGRPLFFCNSLSCESSWEKEYIDRLAKGIAAILDKCETGFIGGDFGYSPDWNFTGIVIGEAEKIVTRKGACPGDLIYLTGVIGSGNFEAASVLGRLDGKSGDFFSKHPVYFPVRMKEAMLISKYAAACIDTSDGLFRSLNIISEINNCGFEIYNVPYFEPGVQWTKTTGLPTECLMFGECGEYELLFTVSPDVEEDLLKDSLLQGCALFKIGRITENLSKILNTPERKMILNDFNISARDYSDHYKYISCLTEFLNSGRNN